jgi:glycerate dehydrogenase
MPRVHAHDAQRPGLKLVFLDAGTVDYGDISLSPLYQWGTLIAYEKTPYEKIEERIRDADIVITTKCRFDAKKFSRRPSLRMICVAATGVNNIDLEAARRSKVAVANVSDYATEMVAQQTVSFILALAGHLVDFNRAARDGRWSRSPFFVLPIFPVQQIAGKVLGIIGYGAIGKRVSEMARVFGMRVLVAKIPGRIYSKTKKVSRVSLNQLFKESDFVSLHTSLGPLTEKIINADALSKMKPTAFLINMSRGGLVDEKALYQALKSKRIAGAASDVLSQEPPPKNHILFKASNMLLTPHIAWISREARESLVHEMGLNIEAFLLGQKRNRVD